jgi:hypothetical protein
MISEMGDEFNRARLERYAGFIGSIIVESVAGRGKRFPGAAI